jgi:hypothetical protein
MVGSLRFRLILIEDLRRCWLRTSLSELFDERLEPSLCKPAFKAAAAASECEEGECDCAGIWLASCCDIVRGERVLMATGLGEGGSELRSGAI